MTNNLTSYLKYVRVTIRRGLVHVQVRPRWWQRWRTVKVYTNDKTTGVMLAKQWAEIMEQHQQQLRTGRK